MIEYKKYSFFLVLLACIGLSNSLKAQITNDIKQSAYPDPVEKTILMRNAGTCGMTLIKNAMDQIIHLYHDVPQSKEGYQRVVIRAMPDILDTTMEDSDNAGDSWIKSTISCKSRNMIMRLENADQAKIEFASLDNLKKADSRILKIHASQIDCLNSLYSYSGESMIRIYMNGTNKPDSTSEMRILLNKGQIANEIITYSTVNGEKIKITEVDEMTCVNGKSLLQIFL